MVEKTTTPTHKVVDLARYRQDRAGGNIPVVMRLCRHCGAPLSEGENEDECSSAFNPAGRILRRFRAIDL